MKLYEWEYRPLLSKENNLPTDYLTSFIDYLSEVWGNRNKYTSAKEDLSEEERQELKMQKQRFFDFTVDGKIAARNYVGVVQYDGLRIEVMPKILRNEALSSHESWGTNLLYWLSYCRKFKFPFSMADISATDFEDFLELLIAVFANLTESTLSKQPYQAYQEVHEEHSYLKGRLLFDDYTRHNLTTGKWQHFYIAHSPLEYDNLFNRIIKHVSRRLHTLAKNNHNKTKLESILFLMHDVSDVSCYASDCQKVKFNPLYTEYNQILELCNLFLSNQFIDLQDDSTQNFCFLIPMEYVFEDFIFGFISQHWPALNAEGQSSTYLAERNNQNVFKIKNDIVIEKQLIIDTKYKLRQKSHDNKGGVNQSDMYQMVSYAIKRNCNNVLLLYPHVYNTDNEEIEFGIKSDMLHSDIKTTIKNIDITFANLQSADSVLQERFRNVLRSLLPLEEIFI